MKKVAIIGSGIGGLASAARFAALGFDVTVFEANEFIGGKINNIQLGQYRFDSGPSVLTAPEYIDELFSFTGVENNFFYHKLEEGFRYFYPDSTRFTLPNDREGLVNTIANQLNENPVAINNYLNKAKRNYNLISPLFIEKSLHSLPGLIGWPLVKALLFINSYKLNSTMHAENKSFFIHPKTVQLFNRFATYNGSSPYKAPAMLNMISHLEINEGVYLPTGGMADISKKLGELCGKLGVKFQFNEKVEEIIVKNGEIKAIRSTESIYNVDAVVSNMDMSYTYEKLLPKQFTPHKLLEQEKSSSAVVFYWGINRKFDELGVHNMFFNVDYREEFSAIFEDKSIYFDPSIYVNISSKFNKTDAPDGCENWFVMVNVPHNTGQNWEDNVSTLRSIVINKLNKELKVNLEDHIEVESHLDPIKIDKKYFSKQGSIYGNASNNKYAAFYRHSNKHKTIRGLYFAGVSVHPGGGIPLALNAAKIAANFAKKDFNL